MSRKPPAFPPSAAAPDPQPRAEPRPTSSGPKFKVGDTCYLQSGSPRMTITHVRDDGNVDVAWCDYSTGEMYYAILPIAALRREWK